MFTHLSARMPKYMFILVFLCACLYACACIGESGRGPYVQQVHPVYRHVYRRVYRHVYRRVSGVWRHVWRHVYTQVNQDVYRTFPAHPVYASEQGKQALKRVLMAFSVMNPKAITYDN